MKITFAVIYSHIQNSSQHKVQPTESIASKYTLCRAHQLFHHLDCSSIVILHASHLEHRINQNQRLCNRAHGPNLQCRHSYSWHDPRDSLHPRPQCEGRRFAVGCDHVVCYWFGATGTKTNNKERVRKRRIDLEKRKGIQPNPFIDNSHRQNPNQVNPATIVFTLYRTHNGSKDFFICSSCFSF